jgi:phosphoribosylanthranilate isomerase
VPDEARIKICCMASEREAALAVAAGASAVGLVAEMPSGPGPIPDDRIALIVRTVPATVHTVLLTSRRRPRDIAAHQRLVGASMIQIVDWLEEGTHEEIRRAVPGVKVVQVVHVTGPGALDQALGVAPHVDALLLDSGRPTLAVKELGGTGRRHDWTVSRRIREAAGVPVFLAGGLTPDNVREALDTVAPFGLDVCSGVRTHGALDVEKLHAFMEAAGVPRRPVSTRMLD